MKITFKKLFYLIAFIGFSFSAKAQYSAVPDTARVSIGPDVALPQGSFADSYAIGVGASVQVDVPLNEKFYVSANLGYFSYLPNNNDHADNPEYILNVKLPDMNLVPLTFGIKYYLIRTFYVGIEGGGTLLLNKSALYGDYSTALNYGPQMGILFKLPNRKYIDVGFRYERMQSFYTGIGNNDFIGIHVAYAFNLK